MTGQEGVQTSPLRGFDDWANIKLVGAGVGTTGANPQETVTSGAEELWLAPHDGKPSTINLIPPSVTMHVKSGGPINPRSNGVTPVAILTTPKFDAAELNVATLRFGAAGNERALEAHGKGHPEDVNGDGRMDLVLHFDTQASGFLSDTTQVCLTGKTKQGRAVYTCAPVQMVGSGAPGRP